MLNIPRQALDAPIDEIGIPDEPVTSVYLTEESTMIMIDKPTLKHVANEALDGRCSTEFDIFEQFWEELDALLWSDAQDAGDDCQGQPNEIPGIFSEMAAAARDEQ